MCGKSLPYWRRLKSIISNGIGYFILPIWPENGHSYKSGFSLMSKAFSGNRNYVFGSATNVYNNRLQFSYSAQRFYGYGAAYSTPNISVNGDDHEVIFSDGIVSEDGINKWTSDNPLLGTSVKRIAILAMNQGENKGADEIGHISNGVKLRFFEDVGVARFVPVIDLEGNPALYDELGDRFAERYGTFDVEEF